MSLVRVFQIPKNLPTQYHFGGGDLIEFMEVDWFRDEDNMIENQRQHLIDFIKAKKYFDTHKAYLVLHSTHTFTIGYSAP